jgi:prepilin-type processing-associated H-X9-DG protein
MGTGYLPTQPGNRAICQSAPAAAMIGRMHPNPHPNTPSRPGFTILELLIVVAVIMVLLGLLYPVVQSVERQAYAADCASSQRQLGTAMFNYTKDWGGYLPRLKEPRNGTDWTVAMHWWNTIADYVEIAKSDNTSIAAHRSVIWGCPLWDKTPANIIAGRIGYGMNFLPHAPVRSDCSDFWDCVPPTATDILLLSVSNLPGRIMIGDANNWFLSAYPPFPTPAAYPAGAGWDPQRHGSGAIYTFYDGHVQRLDQERNAYLGVGDPAQWQP